MALSACATTSQPIAMDDAGPVTIRVIGLNDFHGNLQPLRRPLRLTSEGAAFLGSAIAAARAKNEHSLVISAGDLIGGSPLISSYFLDEPAIGAMNRIGLDFNAVGNHEFDRGWMELLRVQEGGCEQYTLRAPCQVEDPYPGADFKFLAANVLREDGSTLFPAHAMRSFGEGDRRIDVGIVGLTLKDTPRLVTPSGVEGLTFTDEAATINRSVDELARQGADAFIVAVHQGMYTEVGYNDKSCDGVSGPLIDILKQIDPRVDLVISGHTHVAYVCDFALIDPARQFIVVSAGYGGSFFTDIALEVEPALAKATVVSADNVVVQSTGNDREGNPLALNPQLAMHEPDSNVAAYVERYAEASREAATRPVGRIAGNGRDPGPATEETSLGNAIADAQLFATRNAGAQIAFMNNSGIRTALTPRDDGAITFGDIYAVQPFNNTLVTRTYSGTQLFALLEQQFDEEGFVQTFSASQGFALSYDMRQPVGQRVVSATLDGSPIDPSADYRVTMNSFLAAGGDSFTVFEQGRDSVVGAVDLDAFELWLAEEEIRDLPSIGRITRIGE
jgi:5'-nucleotidase